MAGFKVALFAFGGVCDCLFGFNGGFMVVLFANLG